MSSSKGRDAGIGMTSQRTRNRLVQRLREKGIADERVLAAIGRIPRHRFVDEALASRAYEDTALPIGRGQTISQPFVVARMTQALLEAEGQHRVLEVGTGSGYQAAILSQVVSEVFSVERIEELSRSARRKFREVGIRNVRAKHADGNVGWPQQAPFDGIMVTAAAAELPPPLLEQVRVGGVIVAPLGDQSQQLLRITRTRAGFEREKLDHVLFVPLLHGEIR